MALIKHVVDEHGVAQDIPMTPEEEAEFLASLPGTSPPPREISKEELLTQIQALMAKVEALP